MNDSAVSLSRHINQINNNFLTKRECKDIQLHVFISYCYICKKE